MLDFPCFFPTTSSGFTAPLTKAHRLVHRLLRPPSGGVPLALSLGCVHTWMGDTAAAIRSLSVLLESLTRAVDSLSVRVTNLEQQLNVTEGWELVEGSLSVQGAIDQDQIQLEQGPPPIPPAILDLARGLSEKGGGAKRRINSAFTAGFWAQLAVATHTDYKPSEPSELAFTHWVVLRAGGLVSPYRVSKKSDLAKLLRAPCFRPGIGSTEPVVQGFASLSEVRAFCGGAGICVPPLLKWIEL